VKLAIFLKFLLHVVVTETLVWMEYLWKSLVAKHLDS